MTESEERKPPFTFANAHIAWLACLGCLLHRVRCEGLMSIEWLIETPREEGNLLGHFPQALEEPYLSFATDLLRMMVGGNLEPDDMQVYAEHAMTSLMAVDVSVSVAPIDQSLLETIWLTLLAGIKGYPPQVAVEFGRQAIPVRAKPTHGELEGVFREIRDVWKKDHQSMRNMGNRIKSFIESLETGSV